MSTSKKLQLKFYVLDVFTTTPYQGNPLAIVHLPPGHDLEQAQKLNIAREFNLSETVFLHENEEGNVTTRTDIFTTTQELPFAGHPTIGSGWHLLNNVVRLQGATSTTLLTRAGPIPVDQLSANLNRAGECFFSPGSVKLRVPIDFKVHAPFTDATVKKNQEGLTSDDYVNGLDGPESVASIVKGMTFLLLQVKSTDSLARLRPSPQQITAPALGDWAGFISLYAFTILTEDGAEGELDGTFYVRTRMFYATLEDPATGSAASTLAGWLALKKGKGRYRVEIMQGVEMGRRSDIRVIVVVGDNDQIETIELIGSAVQVMEGNIWV
ncbi:hypothetical protein AX15_007129 [Amanita polypyramis BW_CC]|nr:hypothetical protein AX15_007129 [Amanita polypyramis BW_CC]